MTNIQNEILDQFSLNRYTGDLGTEVKTNIIPFKKPETHKRLNAYEEYVYISILINGAKLDQKVKRMSAYLSLKEYGEQSISVWINSKLTSSKFEILTSIKKSKNPKYLEKIANSMIEKYEGKSGLLLGRFTYTAKNGSRETFYKKNIPNCLMCIYQDNNILMSHIHLLGKDYYIELDENTLTDKQKQFYEFGGVYELNQEDDHDNYGGDYEQI